MQNMTENLRKSILDEFGEKNALFVGQDMRANTIALKHKHPVILQDENFLWEFLSYTL